MTMNQKEADTIFNDTILSAKANLEAFGSLTPVLVTVGPQGAEIGRLVFNDPETKAALFDYVTEELRARYTRGDLYVSIVVLDMWAKLVPDDKDPDDYKAGDLEDDHDNAVVVVAMRQPGRFKATALPYTQHGKQITWDEPQDLSDAIFHTLGDWSQPPTTELKGVIQ